MSLRLDRIRNSRAGFALIEVLVAVAVAALIMAALMRAFSDVWGGVTAVRENAEAMLLAQTVLAGVSRSAIAEGEREGGAGRYRRVMTTTQPPSAPRPPAEEGQPPPIGKLYRIVVVVLAPNGRRTSLETYRIATAAR
jgi:prepilin-type N-terminal cleavage/methylation domain-containing protein